MRFKILFMAFMALGFGNLAAAQDVPTESPLNMLYQCAEITDNTERLACFDNNVASLQGKEKRKEIVAIDAEAAKKIKREAFGFSLPSLPKLGLPSFGGSGDDGPEALTLKVKSVRKVGRIYEFRMENGQVWRQASGRFNYIPKGDLVATIKSASVGSYLMSLSNGKERVRGMGVKRTE